MCKLKRMDPFDVSLDMLRLGKKKVWHSFPTTLLLPSHPSLSLPSPKIQLRHQADWCKLQQLGGFGHDPAPHVSVQLNSALFSTSPAGGAETFRTVLNRVTSDEVITRNVHNALKNRISQLNKHGLNCSLWKCHGQITKKSNIDIETITNSTWPKQPSFRQRQNLPSSALRLS